MEADCKVLVDIRKPEVEALLLDWMKRGGFSNAEDALFEALKSQPPCGEEGAEEIRLVRTGAALVAAMRASPHKGIGLETQSSRLPVREIPI
jgi:hypothetical protein